MQIRFLTALAALVATAVVAVAGSGAAVPITVIRIGTTALVGGDVILYEDGGGPAHRVRGVRPAVTNALIALAGHHVFVTGTLDRPAVPNSPILVSSFRVLPFGVADGENVEVIGPTRPSGDGDVIVFDEFGHGHRLYSTRAVSAATIDGLAGRRVRVTGIASVTNHKSYIFWPIQVQSITAVP